MLGLFPRLLTLLVLVLAVNYNKLLRVHGFATLPKQHAKVTTKLLSIPNPIDTLTSGLASICRLPGGVTVSGKSAKSGAVNIRCKELYDIETSRTCRKVRERLTELDLNVEKVIPATSNSRVFTDSTYEYSLPLGTTVPRMVVVDDDSKQEIVLSGAEAIENYLDKKFGVDRPAEAELSEQVMGILRDVGGYMADFLRIGRGSSVSPAARMAAPRPSKPLVLYSYEGNQFCRLVREVLTELDLVYELRNCGKESPRRNELAKITSGSTQCPFLMDEDTGVSMSESADIIRYLYKTYARWTPPNEILEWASNVILPLAKPIFAFLTPLQAGSSREDKVSYEQEIVEAMDKIQATIEANPVVVYTYDLSPFSSETKSVLSNLEIPYKEVSLGAEWFPGFIKEGGSATRAALLEMTGQSSLPHIFVDGKSIGGLFSGTPGLLPSLKDGTLQYLSSTDKGRQTRPELVAPNGS